MTNEETRVCWCDGSLVYAETHPEESKYSAPREVLCKQCCIFRCDAYPGACEGRDYY